MGSCCTQNADISVDDESDNDNDNDHEKSKKTANDQDDEFLGRYEQVQPHIGMYYDWKVGDYRSRYKGNVSKYAIQSTFKLPVGTPIMIRYSQKMFERKNTAIEILKDIRILHALNHDNIIKLHDIIPPTDPKSFTSLMLISDYMDTNLKQMFNTDQFFTALQVQYMLYHILVPIKYIHSAGIVHGNLTPSNILINANCLIKICDFDNSLSINKTNIQLTNSEISTKLFSNVHKHSNKRAYYYAAPEILLLNIKHETLKAIDLWSIGAIFGELLQMIEQNRSQSPTKPIFHGVVKHFESTDPDPSWPDQLVTIFNLIGYPDHTQIAEIENEDAREHLVNLPHKLIERTLLYMFPERDMDALELLDQFIKYDAQKRITVDKALKHKYFERVRDKTKEIECKSKLDTFPMEWEYNNLPSDIFQKTMRRLVLKEVIKYNECDKESIMKSGAMINTAEMMVRGYFRENIKPLLNDNTVIPMPIIQMCFAYWCAV